MKIFKIIILSILCFAFTACDLDEDPIFLDGNAVYSDINIAKGALDGIYQAIDKLRGLKSKGFLLLMVFLVCLLQGKMEGIM